MSAIAEKYKKNKNICVAYECHSRRKIRNKKYIFNWERQLSKKDLHYNRKKASTMFISTLATCCDNYFITRARSFLLRPTL